MVVEFDKARSLQGFCNLQTGFQRTSISWGRCLLVPRPAGSWESCSPVVTGSLLSSLSRCYTAPALASQRKYLHSTRVNPSYDEKRTLEKLWQEFFSDPSQWWDNRWEKVNKRYPDFKHKRTNEGLWLDAKMKPPWVESELARMVPGAVQLDLFTWNTRLARHVKAGECQETMELFQQMLQEGMNPNTFSFVPVLNACASLGNLEDGRQIHIEIVRSGYESEEVVGNCLVDMYAKCGSIEDAWKVFQKMPTRDVVAWSAMILGYVKCGQGEKALNLSKEMQQEGIQPDAVTFVGLLNACATVEALEEGRHVHQHIIRSGCESNVFVHSCLVDMYAKCGSLEDACRVFKKVPTRNVVAWTAMITAYVKWGQEQKALELFRQMCVEGVEPNHVTFMAALNACASLVDLEEGRRIHQEIIQSRCESDVFIGSSLIDMYAKCGSIHDAYRVFDMMPQHDGVSWSTMIAGFALHGYAREALDHFEKMCQEGLQVNDITFISLLSACSRGGLLDEGLHYFESMSSVYGISPKMNHYVCLIDLLGRAGHLHEAEDLIQIMSGEPDATVWVSLLGACRLLGDVKMGERCAKQALELDPQFAAGYVLLSDIYATAGNWDSSGEVRQQRLRRCERKGKGIAGIP